MVDFGFGDAKYLVLSSMPDRENFDSKALKAIKDRAAARCANPVCRRVTRVSSASATSEVITGEAAHIYSAASGGPRGQGGWDATQLKSVANGVWLCKECHMRIDRNPEFYTAEKLALWKSWSEADHAYDFVLPVASLPAHYSRDAGGPRQHWLGIHVMLAKSALRAVCKKLVLEVVSETAFGELRARRYYTSELRVVGDQQGFAPVVGDDWHSFALSDGFEGYVYFGSTDLAWLPEGKDYAPLLFRVVVHGALEDGGSESFSSPWEVGIVRAGNLPRIELDEYGAYSDLVHFANRGPLQIMLSAEKARPWDQTAVSKVLSVLRWQGRKQYSGMVSPVVGRLAFDVGSQGRVVCDNEQQGVEVLWVDDLAILVRHVVKDVCGVGDVRSDLITDYGFFNGGTWCQWPGRLTQFSNETHPPHLSHPVSVQAA